MLIFTEINELLAMNRRGVDAKMRAETCHLCHGREQVGREFVHDHPFHPLQDKRVVQVAFHCRPCDQLRFSRLVLIAPVEVACPHCRAQSGERCRQRGGRRMTSFHASRIPAALLAAQPEADPELRKRWQQRVERAARACEVDTPATPVPSKP